MLRKKSLLKGETLFLSPLTRGCSEVSEGRFVCILLSILICRDIFVLIVFSQNETQFLISLE